MKKKFTIQTASGQSAIYVGERLENLRTYLPDQPRVVISDANVRRHWGHLFPGAPVIEIQSSESAKNLATAQAIYKRLVDLEADRSLFVIGIGGGIVCDVAGFVASTYMRGVNFGFAATTLLAQVDASVGGKNGVNFNGYKNMVGVFNQPQFVLCDPAVLTTLPPDVISCGFAEIIKHAAIADAAMFQFLEQNHAAALELAPDVIDRLVDDSVRIKSGFVSRDETEQGERRKLNFGHTFGHALENVAHIPHGQAVSAGMVVAAALSVQRGYLSTAALERLKRLLKSYDLPIHVDADYQKALEALGKDKKRQGRHIHFVLLTDIGQANVESIELAELETLFRQMR